MKRLLIASVILGSQALPSVAHSTFTSGNELYEQCTVEKGTNLYFTKMAECRGYVMGFVDLMEDMQTVNKMSSCLPVGATAGQIVDVVVKYLREHPELRALPGSTMVFLSLKSAFGCALPTKT